MEKNNEQEKNIWKILCLVLATLLALSWVFFGFLYSKGGMNFSVLENLEQNYTSDDGGAIIGESACNGVKLMSTKISPEDYIANGISPMAETAYMLTPTVTPTNAANKTVLLSLEFKNSESEWAKGKNALDYVTLGAQSVQSGESFTVSCLKAFGEQILVKATAEDNEEVFATCTVDYISRATDIDVTIKKNDIVVTALDVRRSSEKYDFIGNIVWGEGTIQPDECFLYISIGYVFDFAKAVRTASGDSLAVMPNANNQIKDQRMMNNTYTFSCDIIKLYTIYGARSSRYSVFNEQLEKWEANILEVYVMATCALKDESFPDSLGNDYSQELVVPVNLPVGEVDLSIPASEVNFDNSAMMF